MMGQADSPEEASCAIPVTPDTPPEVPSEVLAAAPQQPSTPSDQFSSLYASPAGRRARFCLKALPLVVISLLLALQQMQFKDTWGRSCDYDIKIWATVWMCRSLLQHTTAFIIACFRAAGTFRQVTLMLCRFQTLIFLFKLCWFFYGIKPVLVDAKCDPASKTWGLVLWCIELCIVVAPCVCLCLAACLCLPLLLYCFEEQAEADGKVPTPKDIRDKLKIVKYEEISGEIEARQNEKQVTPEPPPSSPSAHVNEDAWNLNDVASTLTGVTLPDLNQIMRIPGMLRQSPGILPDRSGSNLLPTIVGNQQVDRPPCSDSNGLVCPICFSQFEGTDKVVQMPCHPTHVFHDECLFLWLDSSQVCPVCRGNVVESLKQKEEEKEKEQPENP